MAALAAALVCAAAALIYPEQPDSRAVVRIEVAGDPGQQRQMAALFREFFPAAEFDLVLQESSTINPIEVVDPPRVPPSAAARIWLELGHPKRAVVYVADGAWERVLIRRVEFDELDPVAREEVAYVVDSSVRAILGGGEIGIAREDAAHELGLNDPEREQSDPVPTRPPTAWSLTAGYRIRGWQSRAVQHGPVLSMGAWAQRPKLWAGAALSLRGYLPSTVENGNLRIELAGGHIGALAQLLLPIHRTAAIAFEPNVGLDLLRDRTTAIEEPAQAFPPTVRALPSLGLDAGIDLYAGDKRDALRVQLRGGLDVDLLGIHYVTADTDRTLFSPWRLRPGGSIAVGWIRR